MIPSTWRTCLVLAAALPLFVACTTHRTDVRNEPSQRPSRYLDPATATPGSPGSIGMESQDIVSMTDEIMRDMLANPIINRQEKPAVIVMDAEYFTNDSSQRMNKRLIVDRLRNELFRAANGRLRFISREQQQMVDEEQAKRTTGQVDGSPRITFPTADYRLSGRFQDLRGGDVQGNRDSYMQVLFEMIDLNSGELVYSGMHEFKKSAYESIIYQ